MSAELKLARTVYVRPQKVECPHCGEDVDGWCGDPRGKETTCDDCGEKFAVAQDATIQMP